MTWVDWLIVGGVMAVFMAVCGVVLTVLILRPPVFDPEEHRKPKHR